MRRMLAVAACTLGPLSLPSFSPLVWGHGSRLTATGASALVYKWEAKLMSKTLLLVAGLCAVVVAAVGASSAFAGESTGNGKQTPIGAAPDNAPHASSICSFSGQNPEGLLDPSDPNFEPGRVQN